MPSGHSHSSHSSSHSSHTSSHSHSSHSSSHSSHSSHSGSSHSGSSGGSYYRREDRPRRNQPVGRYPVRTYVCRHHTYQYYSVNWEHGGRTYRKGYYDENGDYYTNINIKNNRTGSSVVCVECEYCGTQKLIELKAGQDLICDACGAPLDLGNIPVDEVAELPEIKRTGGLQNIMLVIVFAIIAVRRYLR